MKIAFALLILFLPLVADAALPPEQVIGQLVADVLRRDDLATLTTILDASEPDPSAWADLRDLIDRFDEIVVDRVEASAITATDDRLVLRLEIEGSAALKARWRPVRPLPRWWQVEGRRAGDEWKITRATTGASRVAAAMLAAPTKAKAERLLAEATDASRTEVIAAYASRGESSADLDRTEHAAALAEGIGNASTTIVALRKLISVSTSPNPARALELARRAEELACASGSPDDLAGALLALGWSQKNIGQIEASLRSYEEAAGLVERCDDPTTPMKALYMYILTHENLGNALEMVRATERLAVLAQRFAREEGEELALFSRGDMHFALGNGDVARAAYLELIRLGQAHGNRRFHAYATFNLALMDLHDQHLDRAAPLLREAIRLLPDKSWERAHISCFLAGVHVRRGALDAAEEALRYAEERGGDPLVLSQIAAQRSDLHFARGSSEQAIGSARQALRQIALVHDRPLLDQQATALTSLGRALRLAGRPAEAAEEFRQAITATESYREQTADDALARFAFFQSYSRAYSELIELLVEQGSFADALRVAEQTKGRGLRDVIARGRIDPPASMSSEDGARETLLDDRVVEVNRAMLRARQQGEPLGPLKDKLATARRELDAFRSEIRLAQPDVGRRQIDDAGTIELPAGSESLAVVEYAMTENHAIAFVVTQTSVRAVRLGRTRAELEREVHEVTRLIASRSPAYRTAARKLYTTLLAPLERELTGITTICVIPDGVLWTVPFHALVTSRNRYLVEQHAIFYAHSLALLRNASSSRAKTSRRLLAFGNPTVTATTRGTAASAFRDVSLGPLADAEAEVLALSKIYSPKHSRVYSRGDAQETVFKREAPAFNVIHIAAHAIVDDRAPLYSAIVLAENRGDDGLLEAREVVDLPLNADLAVLSACETARGRVGAGEGMVGLSWAFFAADCPTTVVSQWNAESAATARLMIDLHRRLIAGEPVAEALRGAQLALRRVDEYSHPFYWAPFVAVGAAHHGIGRASHPSSADGTLQDVVAVP